MHPLNNIAVVGTTEHGGQTLDVCAETMWDYDALQEVLTVTLDSYLRHSDPMHPWQHIKPPWLLEARSIHEYVAPYAANDLAREIARSWRKSVFMQIPEQPYRDSLLNFPCPRMLCASPTPFNLMSTP